MPTDGAEFAKRKPLHGRLYVEVKNGATAEALAAVAVQGRFLSFHHRFASEWHSFARSIPGPRKNSFALAA